MESRLIETYRLPYLEGVRELPPEMRRHLARVTVIMLSPRVSEIQRTHTGTHRV